MNEELKQLIEEEARICVKGTPNTCSNFVEYGFTKGAEFGYNLCLSKWQEAERWRKVSEELPDPDIAVLCRMKSPNVIVEGFIYKHNGISKIETQPDFEFEDYANGEVVEWKPIS